VRGVKIPAILIFLIAKRRLSRRRGAAQYPSQPVRGPGRKEACRDNVPRRESGCFRAFTMLGPKFCRRRVTPGSGLKGDAAAKHEHNLTLRGGGNCRPLCEQGEPRSGACYLDFAARGGGSRRDWGTRTLRPRGTSRLCLSQTSSSADQMARTHHSGESLPRHKRHPCCARD
jgi:hypothetical protein